MTITVQLQMKPSSEQIEALEFTLRACNSAADWISERGFEHGIFTQFALQTRYYRDVRAMFSLGAQATCLIFAKVSDAYKLDRKTKREFRLLGSVSFDVRNLKLDLSKQIISIWTMGGREKIPFELGEYQRDILQRGLIKQCELIRRRDGRFFLHVAVVLPDAMEIQATDALGVDLGIAFIAADSDGNLYSGKKLNKVRHRHQALRRKLQKKGTKSTKRLLRKRSKREANFARDTNHVISKRIVDLAKRTNRAIVVEELTGIGRRIKSKKDQRSTLSNWSFHQLGSFIAYKAGMVGVPFIKVDPAYSS